MPLDSRRIGPKLFQVVKQSAVRCKNVQHNVAVVRQNPVALCPIAFDADSAVTVFVLELTVHLVGDRMHLPLTGAGGDHEEIDD